jgi:hypothetical protein
VRRAISFCGGFIEANEPKRKFVVVQVTELLTPPVSKYYHFVLRATRDEAV